jgi:hypothetical protein
MPRFILIFFFLSFASTAFSQVESQSSFKFFEMKNCVEKKCMRLTADMAESGVYSSVLALKNVKMFLITNNKEEVLQATYGYLDLDGQQLVLHTGKKNETSFNLKSLAKKEYKL